MSDETKLLPIRVMLYDFDLHHSEGHRETVGWKVRVYAPDGVEAEGGLTLNIPQARTDICDAVEVACQHPDFDLPGTKKLRPPSEADRLRALIKQVEWGDNFRDMQSCPWCGEERPPSPEELKRSQANGWKPTGRFGHADTCPAFTPDGQVR